MQENTELHLEEFEIKTRRRDLLPWWIKVFCWLFMLFGIMAIICLILGFIGIKPSLAFYGFETNEPFSLNGMVVIFVGILKGLTSYSLWFEKDYAIKLAKIDSFIGIILCAIVMLVLPFVQTGVPIKIRAELLLLIPFLIKLNNIQDEWENK